MNNNLSQRFSVHLFTGIVLFASFHVLVAAQESHAPLAKLLEARAVCASECGGAQEAGWRLNYIKTDVCEIMIKQPFWSTSIVILVYDPEALDKKKITVEVFEQKPHPKETDKGVIVVLSEACPQSGIFIGTAEIIGSHSTPVIARYITAKKGVAQLSNIEYMHFH